MPEYIISQIRPGDRRGLRQMDGLLAKEGIERDKNLDYSVGLFDEEYELIGTGSCFGNTLRCLAVSSEHQGEGLLNQIITHLIEYQYQRGNMHLFLYTKCSTAGFFGDLGFHEIARVEDKLVFMENRRDGFHNYLDRLRHETESTRSQSPAPVFRDGQAGAVIMNANPFTLGHQYLLEQAAARVSLLHVFVVSEDVSLVPFAVRERLVREGSAHLKNLVFHQTGPYMISNATFPSYFLKDSDAVIRSHAKLDISIFLRIAGALGIRRRFVGEEPFSQVTGIYNRLMKEELEANGILCTIIPRKCDGGSAISASEVRGLLKSNQLAELKTKVPASTYDFFTSREAEPVIRKIRAASEVRHY